MNRFLASLGVFYFFFAATTLQATATPSATLPVLVSGTLLQADGKPAAGLQARLLRHLPLEQQARTLLEDQPDQVVDRARTDASGTFELQAPTPGMWLIEVRLDDGSVLRRPEVLVPLSDDERRIRLLPETLDRSSPLRVRVLDPQGRPLAQARVASRSTLENRYGRWNRSAVAAVTDGKGETQLPCWRDVMRDLRVTAPGFGEIWRGSTQVRCGAHAARALVVRPPAVPSVRVRVSDQAGKSVVGASIQWGRGRWLAGPSQDDGSLTVPAARPFRLLLPQGQVIAGTLPTPPANGETRDLASAAVTWYQGRVLDRDTGDPIEGAWIWDGTDTGTTARSDASGRFRLPANPEHATDRWLYAIAQGYALGQLSSERQTSDGTLYLQRRWLLEGTVVDDKSQPVPNALVEVSTQPRGGAPQRNVTGTNGRFLVPYPDSHSAVFLRISADGFAPRLLDGPAPTGDEGHQRIVLQRGIRLYGLVTDLDGTPVRRATVRLDRGVLGSAEAQTDAEGRYEFLDQSDRRLDLHVSAVSYAPTLVRGLEIPTTGADHDLGTVLLAPEAAFAVQVVNPDGQPIATATLETIEASFFRQPEVYAADAEGTVTLGGFETGHELAMMVRAEGYLRHFIQNFRIPDPESSEPGSAQNPLRVELRPGLPLRGRVLEAGSREPIHMARVQVWLQRPTDTSATAIQRWEDDIHTDDAGNFFFHALPAGTYELSVGAHEFRPAETTVRVPMTDTPTLLMERGANLAVRVLDPRGEPVAGAAVRCSSPLTVTYPSRRTLGDGVARLQGLPADAEVELHIEAQGYPDRDVRHEIRGLDDTMDVYLESGAEVSGRVLDETGKGISGARVWLQGPNQRQTFSAADGSFRLAGLNAGKVRLQAEKGGYSPTIEPPVIDVEDRPITDVDVRLTRGGTIVGQIVGPDFDALTKVNVGAVDLASGAQRAGTVDYQGHFRIESLYPAEWHVAAHVPSTGHIKTRTVTVVPGQEVEVVLDFGDGWTLSGTVVHSGRPITGAKVTVRLRSSIPSGGFTTTDYQGRFRLAGLETGSYQLVVRVGASEHEQEVQLQADQEILLNLGAPAP